jgi:hypothetical protein
MRAAGRRHGQHVVPGEDVGDDQLLDGEGLGDAALGESAHHGTRHAEIGEGLHGHWTDSLRRLEGRG